MMGAGERDVSKMAGYIGLAVRAGQAVTGTEACVSALRGGKAAVVLLDSGASLNTQKRFSDACTHRRVPLVLVPEGVLEKAVGKTGRMALALGPGGLARKVLDCAGQDTDMEPT